MTLGTAKVLPDDVIVYKIIGVTVSSYCQRGTSFWGRTGTHLEDHTHKLHCIVNSVPLTWDFCHVRCRPYKKPPYLSNAYRQHPSSCWQPQNQENNRLPLYSAYGLYNVARLQGDKNLEFRPTTKFVQWCALLSISPIFSRAGGFNVFGYRPYLRNR